MSVDTATLKGDRAALLAALERAGADVSRPSAMRCPFHEDQHPSAGVYQREDGTWAFKCHGCGVNFDLIDVEARLTGSSPEEVLRGLREPKPARGDSRAFSGIAEIEASVPGRHEATYLYHHPDSGVVDLAVIRWHDGKKKGFYQAHCAGGSWHLKKPPGLQPLYNRTRLRDAEEVVLVEGEKCVHALHRVGIVATTWPGGCKAVEGVDWRPLAGKSVVLWPDHDDNGREAMQRAAECLHRLSPPASTRLVATPSPGADAPGADAADVVEAGGDPAAIIASAESSGPSHGLRRRIEAMAEGAWAAVPLPWPLLSNASRALLPGTVTLMCGEGGSSKSFWLLQAMVHWHTQGYRVAVMELEDDQTYHLHRTLAILTGNSRLTDDEWVRENPDEALVLSDSNAHLIDELGRVIHDAPAEGLTLDQMAEWAEQRAAEGCRVIAIDPVTAAEPEREPWVADKNFLKRLENAMVKHEASAVLVTHPRGGTAQNRRMTQDDMAGGRAYPRFAKTAFGMAVHADGRKVQVRRGRDKHIATANRSIRILKARNGLGHGWELAYHFDGGRLCFEELGIILEDVT